MIDPRLIQRKQLLFDASMQEASGRFEEAAAIYQKIIDLTEPDARLLHLRAVACRRAGMASEARRAIEEAVRLAGPSPVLIAEQAEQAADRGDIPDAIRYLTRATSSDNPDSTVRRRLAELLLDSGDPWKSAYIAEQSVAAGNEGANLVLARARRHLRDWAGMLNAARRALEHDPQNGYAAGLAAEALLNLGLDEQAAEMVRDADETGLALYADALKGKGMTRLAAEIYAQVLERTPEDQEVQFNLATAMLAGGLSRQGFEAYECRFTRQQRKIAVSGLPRWDGSSLAGKHLLIRTEQGLGEEILYLRPLATVTGEAASVTLEVTDRLVPLLRRAHPDVTIVPRTSPPPDELDPARFDWFCPAGDLIRYRQTDMSVNSSWLTADSEATQSFAEVYDLHNGQLKVGLCWGTERTPAATSKSIPTALLRPLLRTTGITFVSLQFGKPGQAEALILEKSTGRQLCQDSKVDALKNLDNAAAQIAALDLIICISTTTAHLAGAMGKDVWVLLNNRPLWHWFSDGNKSPWYAGARLYRQTEPGDWTSPLMQVRRDLEIWRDNRSDR